MSLFTVCNCWSTQCADLEENYDVASLLCARFGVESHEKDYVLVGSHGGYLSIFYPTLQWQRHHPQGDTAAADGAHNHFSASDLMLEMHLSAPVLGLYAGRFSSSARSKDSNQLAVLHPNTLAVYQVLALDGVAEHGAQLCLQLLVEYKFQRVAIDLCKGHFGQVKGREFFCVVHMDGVWTFYEQDGISYECEFVGHPALPAPVAYCERTDSFIRFSATWHLECFTYQDLSHSSINKSRYQATWSVCLGEGLLDLRVVQVKEEYAALMALGERNFYCLRDNGKLEFTLKMEYVPKCFCAFVVGYYWEPTARLITAIVSDNGRLCVYHDGAIVWGAQYAGSGVGGTVALQRSNVNGLPGALISLGANGNLQIGYLGSEPYNFELPTLGGPALSFGQAYKDLMQLEQEIRDAVDVRNQCAINERAAADVALTFRIAPDCVDSDALLLFVPAEVAVRELPACKGRLRLKSRVELRELQIAFSLPTGIRCSRDSFTYTDVSAGWSEDLELDFYIAELQHVHSTRVEAVVSFVCDKAIPRVLRQSAHMPLAMFYRAVAPQKQATIKLTFGVSAPGLSAKIAQFFPEFVTADDAHALGLQLLCPGGSEAAGAMEIVTVVAAKNSNRLRVQSDSLEALPMILERLARVAREHAEAAGQPRSLVATALLPAAPILHRIDVHRVTQENIREQTEQLDGLWQEFKTLQRRLQEQSDGDAKEALVMQIEQLYDQMALSGDKLMAMRTDEKRQRCDLNCAIAVATLIVALLPLEAKIAKVISSVLPLPIEDWTELSWEESMAPGIDMIHHYGPLSRSKGETGPETGAPAAGAHEQFDYARFRRYFATLFERVVRIASAEPPTQSQPAPQQLAERADAEPPPSAVVVEAKKLGALGKRRSTLQLHRLEVVEDNEEDEATSEERPRRTASDDGAGETTPQRKADGDNDWVNEQFEVPSTEDLFTDLGIWW